MTTANELDVPVDDTEAPSQETNVEEPGEGSSEAGGSTPQPSAREIELEQRLRRQGSELAQARRIVQQTVSEISSLRGEVTRITARQTQQEQEQSERRERERANYLDSLPPERRTQEEVRLLTAEVKALKSGGTAVQTPRPAPDANAEDPDVAYMRARAQELLTEVQNEFGVELTQQDIQSLAGTTAWDSEEAFQLAITRIAAKKSQGGAQNTGGNVAQQKKPETEAQMRERITREVQEGLGAGSPATARAAGKAGKRPTEEDVRQQVQTYSSASGPKGNLKALKEMRAKMG